LLTVLGLSGLGAGVAAYLTYTHYNHDALVCTVGNCGTVQTSEYATIGPIPIALLGLGMFVTVAALALARLTGQSLITTSQANIACWTLAFAGLLYYVYLTYVEIWVIDAVCQWCVATSIITLAIFAVESVLLWRSFDLDDDR
jgi:uncharacterized membrane protein